MSKSFRKLVNSLVLIAITIGNSPYVHAQIQPTANTCTPPSVALLFFNGVNTTPQSADIALKELKALYGTLPSGGSVQMETLYNYSSGFEDFVETFEQRLASEGGLFKDRFELFLQITQGHGTFLSKIITSVTGAASIFDSLRSLYLTKAISQLTSLAASPPTQVNYLEQKTRLDTLLSQGKKLLFFPHSQGNLFANVAYDYAMTKTTSDSVKVVHVAPASPTLRGNYVLADLDLVVNGLRLIGTVPSVTDHIPGYLLRPPGVNGETDFMGHGLLEIYVNESMPDLGYGIPATHIRNYVNQALTELQQCKPVAPVCPDMFTQTQLAQVKPSMTVADVDQVFACQHQGGTSGSNWVVWSTPGALIRTDLDMAFVYFTNGVYLGNKVNDKYILGPVIP